MINMEEQILSFAAGFNREKDRLATQFIRYAVCQLGFPHTRNTGQQQGHTQSQGGIDGSDKTFIFGQIMYRIIQPIKRKPVK